MYFINLLTGIAAGNNGLILKTTNGGNTWSSQAFGSFNHLYTINFIPDVPGFGYVCGGRQFQGTVLKTTDAGETWINQFTGSSSRLYGVFILDENIGYAVGEGGTILKTNNGGVPVELNSFSAITNGNDVILKWTTATETNNSGFEIQRNSDSLLPGEEPKGWVSIGFVPGFGTTTELKSYSFQDNDITTGIYYYRLNQIDFNGDDEVLRYC